MAMMLQVIIIKCAGKTEFDENCTEGLRSLSFIDTEELKSAVACICVMALAVCMFGSVCVCFYLHKQ